ncbi:MAG: hypothetical protein AAFX78_12715 [Cyanobacteria bacterium J06638_20]
MVQELLGFHRGDRQFLKKSVRNRAGRYKIEAGSEILVTLACLVAIFHDVAVPPLSHGLWQIQPLFG